MLTRRFRLAPAAVSALALLAPACDSGTGAPPDSEAEATDASSSDAMQSDDVAMARDALGVLLDAAPPATLDDAALIRDGGASDAVSGDAVSVSDALTVDVGAMPDAGDVCPTFGPAVEIGHVADAGLAELSGLAESRVSPGILFAHGDNAMDLFAVRASDGEVRGHWTLRSGGRALTGGDVEDIAIASTSGGGSAIYLGDIGGGSSTLRIARIPEPVVPATGPAASGALDAELMLVSNLLGLAIPDSETLLVDPVSGEVVLVTKDRSARPCSLGPFVAGSTATPDCSAPVIAGLTNPSGGDVSPDGRFVILRNEGTAYLWLRPASGTLASAFGGLRCAFSTLEHTDECNGEAIAFASDGLGIFTGSERSSRGGGSCPMTHLHSYSLSR